MSLIKRPPTLKMAPPGSHVVKRHARISENGIKYYVKATKKTDLFTVVRNYHSKDVHGDNYVKKVFKLYQDSLSFR